MKHKRVQAIFSILMMSAAAFFLTFHTSHADEERPRIAVGGLMGMTGVREGSSNPAQSKGMSSSRKVGWGAGVLIESLVAPTLGVETGMLFLERKFEIKNGAFSLTRTVPTLIVPLEARFWLIDSLSVAGGVFGSVRVGDQKDEYAVGNSTFASVSSGGREAIEFGMTLAATFGLLSIDKTGIFVEARYNRGFTNASKDGVFEERMDDLIFMAGVRL